MLLHKKCLFFIPQLCGLCSNGLENKSILYSSSLWTLPLLKSILHPYIFLFDWIVSGWPTMPRVHPRHGPVVGPGWHGHDPQSGRAVFGPSQNGVLWAGPWASGHMAIYNPSFHISGASRDITGTPE
jgi:hypothetical protein